VRGRAEAQTPLAHRLLSGDPRALARCISLIEEESPQGRAILRAVYRQTGRALVVGITGPPGAGKSSLTNRLVGAWRKKGERVGIIAVDPSSAFSGGAILGDRIRMQEHALDPGVFIRSMATRGHSGGVARASRDVVDLMDAAGYGVVLIETVGVGQDEVEVVRIADLVLVVLPPGLGDDIQAIKAGILEIADLFVINKADREGADRLAGELQAMMALAPSTAATPIPILKTVATTGAGVDDLMEAVGRKRQERVSSAARLRRERDRSRERLLEVLKEELFRRARRTCLENGEMEAAVEDLARRKRDPYSAAEAVLRKLRLVPAKGTPGKRRERR
jgi:LAO/AO transport system kinase